MVLDDRVKANEHTASVVHECDLECSGISYCGTVPNANEPRLKIGQPMVLFVKCSSSVEAGII